MAIAAPPSSMQTLADVLDCLGHIPPERIRVSPEPGTANEQHAIDINESNTGLVELIDGILVEKTVSYYESNLAFKIARMIDDFLATNEIGAVAGADGMVRLSPGQIRVPDVSFVAWDSLSGGEIPEEPVLVQAPDLAVEVLSRSNTKQEMDRKLRDYFTSGVRAVWVLNPKTKSMKVYSAPDRFEEVGASGTVDGGEVLPGFQLSLENLFRQAARKRRQ